MNKKTVKKGMIPYLFLGIFIILVLFLMNMANNQINVFTYDELNKNLENISEISITPSKNGGVYELSGKLKDYKEGEYFYVQVLLFYFLLIFYQWLF